MVFVTYLLFISQGSAGQKVGVGEHRPLRPAGGAARVHQGDDVRRRPWLSVQIRFSVVPKYICLGRFIQKKNANMNSKIIIIPLFRHLGLAPKALILSEHPGGRGRSLTLFQKKSVTTPLPMGSITLSLPELDCSTGVRPRGFCWKACFNSGAFRGCYFEALLITLVLTKMSKKNINIKTHKITFSKFRWSLAVHVVP